MALPMPNPYAGTPWRKNCIYEIVRESDHYYLAALRKKFSLHPVVERMLAHEPANVMALAHEWPHISETDVTRLAYTRSPADGAADRQLITSIGKYLARHWPNVSDHLRRDAQALFTPDNMVLVHTIPEIIEGIELGPHSCMCSASGSIQFGPDENQKMVEWMSDKSNEEPNWDLHPYYSYDPTLGWHMALRRDSTGKIQGRAMCFKKDFVRTYRRGDNADQYSHTDEVLAAWLMEQGYKHIKSWVKGTPLRCRTDIPGWTGTPQCPYIDGEVQRIRETDDENIFVVDASGKWDAGCTGGFADSDGCGDDDDDDESYVECACCGNDRHESRMNRVGRNEDVRVCDNCLQDNYVEVRAAPHNGRLGGFDHYFLHGDDAVPVENCDFQVDPDHLPHGIVETETGEYAVTDDTVCIDGN